MDNLAQHLAKTVTRQVSFRLMTGGQMPASVFDLKVMNLLYIHVPASGYRKGLNFVEKYSSNHLL